MADEESELNQPLIIFGRDVTKIPCFRGSWLYGFGSGVSAGLLVFLFTSNPKLASNVALGTLSCVTMSYFVVCRYKFAQQKFHMSQIRRAYEEALILDGTKKSRSFDEPVTDP